MDELGMATSALVVVALPLVGLGPLLRRLLGRGMSLVAMGILAGIVYWLTGQLWAAIFTAGLGVATVVPRRPSARERLAVAFRLASERRSAWR